MNFKGRLELPEDFVPLSSTADIMFLLLIFFLVTTTFTVENQKGINMQLPDTVVQEEIPMENVAITVDTSEKIFIGNQEVQLKEIAPLVKLKLEGHPERYVIIKSDKGNKYGKVVDILDELFQAGIHNIALPTKKEEVGAKPTAGQ